MTTTPELPSVERGEMKMDNCPPSASCEASSGKSNGSSETRHVAPPEWFNMNSAPKDGTRIRVMHELARNDEHVITAIWGANGWVCSEVFIDPVTCFTYRRPTHWTHLRVSDGSREAGETVGLDPKDDSAVGAAETPLPSSPNKVEDLIGRLRQFDRNSEFGKPHLEQAATLLQDQQSEISRLKEELQDARDKRNRWFTAHGIERTARVAAEAQVASLKAALEPFRSGGGWGKFLAWLVNGAPTREVGIAASKQIVSWKNAVDAALSNTAADKGDGHE